MLLADSIVALCLVEPISLCDRHSPLLSSPAHPSLSRLLLPLRLSKLLKFYRNKKYTCINFTPILHYTYLCYSFLGNNPKGLGTET